MTVPTTSHSDNQIASHNNKATLKTLRVRAKRKQSKKSLKEEKEPKVPKNPEDDYVNPLANIRLIARILDNNQVEAELEKIAQQGKGTPWGDKGTNTYCLREVFLSTILLYLFNNSSRNHYNLTSRTKQAAEHAKSLLGIKLPHGDTLHRRLSKICPEVVVSILTAFGKGLMASNFFRFEKINGCFQLMVDGTGLGNASSGDFWSTKKTSKNGKESFTRSMVLLCISGPNNMAIPIDWEPIHQQDGHSKQDCEIAAAKRLLARNRKTFPRTEFVVGGDALYFNEPNLLFLRELNYYFIFTFKMKRFAELKAEVLNQLEKYDDAAYLIDDSIDVTRKDYEEEKIHRLCSHTASIEWKNHIVQVIPTLESSRPLELAEGDKSPEGTENTFKNFCFITNFPIDNPEDALLIEAAGRKRYLIEDAFNTAKNRGVKIKHRMSRVNNSASQNFNTLALCSLAFRAVIQKTRWYQDSFMEGRNTYKANEEVLKSAFCGHKGSKVMPPDLEQIENALPHQLEYRKAA